MLVGKFCIYMLEHTVRL